MCGILFSLLYKDDSKSLNYIDFINSSLNQVHRGPDETIEVCYNNENYKVLTQFHRLKINGGKNASQPFIKDNVLCVCNGEIYNYLEIINKFNLSSSQDDGDCKCIIDLYIWCRENNNNFIDYVKYLDGDFAFIIYDRTLHKIYTARDPFGVRSMYFGQDNKEWYRIGFGSEVKALQGIVSGKISPLMPGYVTCIDIFSRSIISITKFWEFPISYINYETKIMDNIVKYLDKAITKRMMSDRPIGCMLSGGLDSSLICALVAKKMKDPSLLHTFSIGMKGSTDLIYAENVAKYIGTTHHTIIVTEEELLNSLDNLIYQLESYDVTTVRASAPMYFLAKQIKKMIELDITVIMSGEGADEVCGGYIYLHNAPSSIEFDTECKRLVSHLHYFDVNRVEKSIAGASLETRVPFLDRDFVNMYFNIHPKLRQPGYLFNIKREKSLLREAFLKVMPNLLPIDVFLRPKEAFSDGVSSQKRGWYQILQEKISPMYPKLTSIEAEREHYKTIFSKYFGNRFELIPYQWLPSWSDNQMDPSARVLNIYKE